MNVDDPLSSADSLDELDDPYVQTVSAEEFVQSVELATQEETDEKLTQSQE